MFTRITSDLMSNNLLAALNQTQQGQNDALSQVETQRRVNLPSDDPAAAALFSLNQSSGASVTQYLQNINSLTGQLQTSDSALASAVTMLNRALTLGTSGSSGTLSATDQQALGQEVGQISQQMLAVANTTFQGTYVFAGAGQGPAYVADNTQPDGVKYQGDGTVNQVQVAQGTNVAVNVPGSQIFQNASGSIFQSLHDLAQALNSGNTAAAQTATGEVQNAINSLNQQRVFYGTTVNRLQTTNQFLQNEQLNLTSQQNTLVGADLASALTQLSSAQLARSAILAAAGKISQQSLLNFLPQG